MKMKKFSLVLSTVAVILAAVAIVFSYKKSSALSEEELAQALKNSPQMVVDALNAYQEQQRVAQEKAAQEALQKFAAQINSSANVPFVGPEDAKVTVVEFFDFSCGYCKRLAPAMEKVVAANSDVKFVFKPLSFVSPVSGYQAKAALAMNKQGKFLEFYKAVLDAQGRMTEGAVDELAKSLNVDFDQYKADLASDDVTSVLNEIRATAQNANINGVPAVIINGRHVQTMSADDLQAAIDEAK